MLKSIGLGNQRRGIARELSGFYTSITLFTSTVAAAQHIGLDLNRATVAIEGFGNVGIPTAQAFWIASSDGHTLILHSFDVV